MKNVAIIFGYNNTRIYDIERLKLLCKRELNADIMLCKEQISPQDVAMTEYTLAISLEIHSVSVIQEQIQKIDRYLSLHDLHPVICLPFSDKGIPLGSYYARSKNIMHDDCERSFSCIDKYSFRCLEAEAETPSWYKKPFFTKIYSYAEAEKIIRDKNISLFFKPMTEGNSRGCIEINSIADLEMNKEILNLYLAQGIIVEECIKNCDEYSFDGVDGNYVITEKKTSQGYYRVETQHILPAPLSPFYYQRLMEAGKIVASISGSRNGAVHNELFLNRETGDVYCVEPNRRPAGLKLWDWITEAFPGVYPWDKWIAWASGQQRISASLTTPSHYVGCRMLKAPVNGLIQSINMEAKKQLEAREDVVEINITKTVNTVVKSLLKDNSDFLGFVVCKNASVDHLRVELDSLEQEIMKIFVFK